MLVDSLYQLSKDCSTKQQYTLYLRISGFRQLLCALSCRTHPCPHGGAVEWFSFACTMCHCQGHSRVAPAGFLPLHVDECSSIQPLSLLSHSGLCWDHFYDSHSLLLLFFLFVGEKRNTGLRLKGYWFVNPPHLSSNTATFISCPQHRCHLPAEEIYHPPSTSLKPSDELLVATSGLL